MQISQASVLITGGSSGLGRACAKHLVELGAHVVLLDLPSSAGAEVVTELGPDARFVPGDVTSPDDVAAAVAAAGADRPLRGLVHCAGIGSAVRLVERDGSPGSLEAFSRIVQVNLIGTYNVLRHAAAAMAATEPDERGERGACVLTSSVAAFEGQIGQIGYSASKSGVVGLTLVAARDLARARIRVCTIAPGIIDTPLLGELRDDIRAALAASVPNPSRLGEPAEFAELAAEILRNGYLNGETIRLDGAIRMAPR